MWVSFVCLLPSGPSRCKVLLLPLLHNKGGSDLPLMKRQMKFLPNEMIQEPGALKVYNKILHLLKLGQLTTQAFVSGSAHFL